MRRQVQIDMSGAARRARCRACPLYNEHQHHKYRAFFWLAYPATAAVVVALMPVIHVGYTMLATVLQRLVSGTAFLPNREPEFRPFLSVVLETKGIEFLVVLAVAFVVVSYLLELTEYLVFDVKI
jgi:hypothetical protein